MIQMIKYFEKDARFFRTLTILQIVDNLSRSLWSIRIQHGEHQLGNLFESSLLASLVHYQLCKPQHIHYLHQLSLSSNPLQLRLSGVNHSTQNLLHILSHVFEYYLHVLYSILVIHKIIYTKKSHLINKKCD